MNAAQIFGPFLAMIALTMVVWVYIYPRRLPFIMRSNLTPQQLTPVELSRLFPPSVANPSDSLKNLFELPTIFYVLVVCLYVAGHVDSTCIWTAWPLVGFRVLHSAVHCTLNFVPW